MRCILLYFFLPLWQLQDTEQIFRDFFPAQRINLVSQRNQIATGAVEDINQNASEEGLVINHQNLPIPVLPINFLRYTIPLYYTITIYISISYII